MRTLGRSIALFLILILTQTLAAQEDYREEIAILKEQKEQITLQEKEALKREVEKINRRLDRGDLTVEEAKILKENAAKKRALNIENRLAIIDNRIALLERNEGEVLKTKKGDAEEDQAGFSVFINDEAWTWLEGRHREHRYDRRTYSDLVLAIGFNNAIIEGESLDDSPYKIGGSRFF